MRPPHALRGCILRRDNITLMPASALPFKREWEALQRGLPADEALLVAPVTETPRKRPARPLVPHLRARGRHAAAIPASSLRDDRAVRRLPDGAHVGP